MSWQCFLSLQLQLSVFVCFCMCCDCRMRFTPSLAFRHPPLEEGRRKPALGAWRFARSVPHLLPMGLNGLRCRADILGTNCKTLLKSINYLFFKGRGVVSASVRVTVFRTASRRQLLVQLCDQWTIPTSEAWVWYEYRPLPSGTSRAAVQQRLVHGHFTRWTLIFRFKSMGEEKWTAGQGHKGRTCPL